MGFCFPCRESLRRHRILDPTTGCGHRRNHRGSLRIWHFRDDREVMLAEREIQVEQLATRLFE
jgi:hypothetical protein